jgi:hypothetical protein
MVLVTLAEKLYLDISIYCIKGVAVYLFAGRITVYKKIARFHTEKIHPLPAHIVLENCNVKSSARHGRGPLPGH